MVCHGEWASCLEVGKEEKVQIIHDFAPYRFVKIEILSSDCIEDAHIFRWYDSENDSVDEVLFQICKCLDIAKKYNVQKDS